MADWIGFVGVFVLLLSFTLNLLGKISQNSYPYILMNLVGSALACLASFMIEYIPFVILEGTWCVVSLVALVMLVRKPLART